MTGSLSKERSFSPCLKKNATVVRTEKHRTVAIFIACLHCFKLQNVKTPLQGLAQGPWNTLLLLVSFTSILKIPKTSVDLKNTKRWVLLFVLDLLPGLTALYLTIRDKPLVNFGEYSSKSWAKFFFPSWSWGGRRGGRGGEHKWW